MQLLSSKSDVETMSGILITVRFGYRSRHESLVKTIFSNFSRDNGIDRVYGVRVVHRVLYLYRTLQISDPAPLILNCKPERHRRVHCIWLVRPQNRHTKYSHFKSVWTIGCEAATRATMLGKDAASESGIVIQKM